MAPDEFRRRNLLHQGMTTATNQVINEPIVMDQMLERALELTDYHAKVKQFAAHNLTSTKKKGIGIGAFLHGAGFTGSGERYLNALVGVEATAAGGIRVLVSSTEFGQGTNTILCQIAAETLGLEYDDVSMAPIDTSISPNSGPTVASRTAMIIGKIVQTAALKMRQTLIDSGLLEASGGREQFLAACQAYRKQFGELQSFSRYEAAPNIFWNDELYSGEAYGAYAWAVYMAEVTVDTLTYSVTIDDFVALQEIGKVIHPVLAAGQIEGGVAQANRLCALRESGVERRAHDQQPDDQLHHAHCGRHPADSRLLRRGALPVRRRMEPKESASCPWTARHRRSSMRWCRRRALSSTPFRCCRKISSAP